MKITPQDLLDALNRLNQKLSEAHLLAEAELTVLKEEARIEGENGN